MPSFQIRNLPDDLYQALAFRAERAHKSLAQQAVIELRRATATGDAQQRRQQVLSKIRQDIEEEGPRTHPSPPEDLIRDDRER